MATGKGRLPDVPSCSVYQATHYCKHGKMGRINPSHQGPHPSHIPTAAQNASLSKRQNSEMGKKGEKLAQCNLHPTSRVFF